MQMMDRKRAIHKLAYYNNHVVPLNVLLFVMYAGPVL